MLPEIVGEDPLDSPRQIVAVEGWSQPAGDLVFDNVGEPLLVSTPRFIASQSAHADPWKRRKMEDLVLMLRGAIKAEGKVGLKLNVRLTDMDRVLGVLKEHPKTSLNSPTVSPLTDPEWVALETIIDEDIVRHIVGSGVPVMGHIGLTPQSVNQLGGYRVQGRSEAEAETLLRQADELAGLGCFALVLECIPSDLAGRITASLTIPTIGIGAGPTTDGQVLVLQDLWGVDSSHPHRFVRRYVDGECLLTDALNRYDGDVKTQAFPTLEESFS